MGANLDATAGHVKGHPANRAGWPWKALRAATGRPAQSGDIPARMAMVSTTPATTVTMMG